MKTIKKILIITCVIIIAVGMFILGRQGLNYVDGYTQNILIDTAKSYTTYISIATLIVLIFLVVRYSKQGIAKVTITSILGILGAIAFTVSVMAITRMPTTRLFFPIILSTYVSSLIVLSSYFEQNA